MHTAAPVSHHSPIMKRLLAPIPLSLYGAVLLALAFPGWSIHGAAWFALAPIVLAIRSASPRAAFLRAFIAGWVFHALLLHWLAANVFWAGGWALAGWLALSAYLAVYWGIAGATYAWATPRLPAPVACLLFAALWTVMEWGQAVLFTGFGWSALAYSQGPNPWVAQLAAVGGTALIAFLVALVNALLAQSLAAPRRRALYPVAALILVTAAHGGGRALLGEAEYLLPAHRVGIFQSDFSQDMKWDPEYTVDMVDNAARKSAWLAANAGAELIVWPEALVMADPKQVAQLGEIIASTARDYQCDLFIGSVRDHPERAEGYNSVYLVSKDGEFRSHYDKVHLAPMGEYIPFAAYFPFLRSLVPSVGDVPPGDALKVIESSAGKLGPLICFEVLFAADARALRDAGAERLVVITNLGWFGASAVLHQELEIARIRAIETRLPLVHAGNTGISGVFDPYGRFSPVDTYIDPSGRTYTFPEDAPLAHRTMQRLVGAFDVAEPARRIAALPRDAVAIVSAIFCAVLLIAAAVRRRTAPPEST